MRSQRSKSSISSLAYSDFEDFFYNFCYGEKFLKEWKQGKGLDWSPLSFPLVTPGMKIQMRLSATPHQPSRTNNQSTSK